jgi:hypothetical protein
MDKRKGYVLLLIYARRQKLCKRAQKISAAAPLRAASLFGCRYHIWRFRRECLHQRVVRNTIFRKAPPSVVSGYGKRSINLNKVATPLCKMQLGSKPEVNLSVLAPG